MKSSRRNLGWRAAVAVAVALALVGCTTSGGNDANSAGTTQIRSVFAAAPHSFAPYQGNAVDDYVVSGLMYEPLVFKDEGNTFIPGLATKWDVAPTQGVFTIRQDAKCGDGTTITASMVVDSLKKYAGPESNFASTTFGAGAPTFTADDTAGTVKITLAQPWTDLLSGLSLPASGIVCPAGLKDPEGLKAGTVPGSVSGPYTLAKKQLGVQYEFDLRKDYDMWPSYTKPLQGKPADKILFSVNAEGSVSTNQLLTGTMDVAVVRGKDMVRLQAAKGIHSEKIPGANLFIMFNERAGHPFTDVTKRRAVAEALSREAFNQAANGGLGELSASYALPAVPCYNTDSSILIHTNAANAAKRLNGLKVRVLGSQAFGPNGAANSYVAEALRAAGANVSLQNVDNATWAADGRQKPDSWDIIVFGNINAAATMWGVMSLFVGKSVEDGGANWTGYEDKPMQQLVTEAMAEPDESKRCAIYDQAQKTIIRDARIIPMSTLASMVAARDGFSMRAPNKTRADFTMRIGG